MARGMQLIEMVTAFKEECGHATSAALSQNFSEHVKNLLRRTQEVLWNAHDWPHMLIQRDETILAGQRYYTLDPDISFERVQPLKVTVKYAGTWRPVAYGIGEAQYNITDSDEDERDSPILRWQHYENNQFEVWPIAPSDDEQTLRFRGIKKLSPLLADSDTSDLDGTLVVLFAAAEQLARQKSADAEAKQSAAQQMLRLLKGQQSKSPMFVNGGGSDPRDSAYYRPRPLYGKKV